MLDRLHRLLVWLGVQAFGPTAFRNSDRDERATARILYSTSGRGVHAAPIKAPATRSTSRRMTEEGTLDGTAV